MIDRIKRLILSFSRTELSFYILGIGSTIWFLIRVVPKPSRAAYPCVRATAPLMSTFFVYLLGLASTVYLFKSLKGRLINLKAILSVVFVASLLFSFTASTSNESQLKLVDASYFKINEPTGVAKGIFPGRVVWIHDPNATNGTMTNTTNDYWAMDKNCTQSEVDSMLESGIRRVGGNSNPKLAWNNIFKYFNENHGKGSVGFTSGEKIAIKINLTNSAVKPNSTDPTRMDASPQMMLGMLKQLIEVVGFRESDIWIGDNYRRMRDEFYSKCHSVYPNVHYIDGKGSDGREKTIPSAEQLLIFSGRNPSIPDEQMTSSIPQHYLDADYLINMPCLKTHNEGGITLAAKNHQGTILKAGDMPEGQSAMYMHFSLPANRQGLKQYRHLVDYMGHEQLGGKTLLYIIDGLWAGRSWEGYLEKWNMSPFNNDYPSSIFMSQDPVAIESVGFDFLLTEYANKPSGQKYPYISGADDYLLQAADPANWPDELEYDPEGDGTFLTSLGVYEHWNNAAEKKYSRDLGIGSGIELVHYESEPADNYQSELTGNEIKFARGCKIYPNPFTESLMVEASGNRELYFTVTDLSGRVLFSNTVFRSYNWDGRQQNGRHLSAGFYLVRLTDKVTGDLISTQKIICNNI